MKRRPASLPAPQLLIDEHPIKGAPVLLDGALGPIRTVLAGLDLATVAIVLASPDSALASARAAWSLRPHLGLTSRDTVLDLAKKLELTPRDFTHQQVPVLIGVGKRAQLVTLDFSEAKPRRRGAA